MTTDADRTELKGYGVLDTPNEPEFDAIVKEAANVMGVPIALISLLDENRQWFKARVGLSLSETPLAMSFCTHAVRGPAVFTVSDASVDDTFANNPLVTGDPGIRFYAGAPLKTPGGNRIGTICVIDDKPREPLSSEQEAALERLATATMDALERRKARAAA